MTDVERKNQDMRQLRECIITMVMTINDLDDLLWIYARVLEAGA